MYSIQRVFTKSAKAVQIHVMSPTGTCVRQAGMLCISSYLVSFWHCCLLQFQMQVLNVV